MSMFKVQLDNPRHLHFIIFVPASNDAESKTVAEQQANSHPTHSQYGPWFATTSKVIH